MAENEIAKIFNDKRKQVQIEYIQNFFGTLQRDLNNNSIQLEDNENDEKVKKESIEQMELDNQNEAMNIMYIIKDLLKDIQSAQRRMLDYNGYSIDKIDNIDQKVKQFIDVFVMNNADKANEILQEDNEEFKSWLLSEYEEYLNAEKLANNKEETQKNPRQEFANKLNANIISQEEQKDFAKKANEDKASEGNEMVEALPDDLII